MGRLIILPLRVRFEIPDLEPGPPITLPPILVPPDPPAPAPGAPPIVPAPPPAEAVLVVDISGELPREPANDPSPPNAYKTSVTAHWLGEAGPTATQDAEIRAELELIARQHIAKDWGGGARGNGIMYHEAIAPSGTVFILRDYTEVPWHAGTPEANLHSRAILVMCSIQRPPTIAQMRVLRRRIDDFQVPAYSHSDWSPTQCPGDQLREVVNSSR